MGKLYSFSKSVFIVLTMSSLLVNAQSSQYQRKKSVKATELPSAVPAPAADAKKPAKPAGEADAAKPASDKVDLSELENQYWTPKDREFSVVQNRKYSKEKRFGLSLQGGMLVNDAYSTGYGNMNITLAYYFTEKSGLELNFTSYKNDKSKIVERFEGENGVLPNYNEQTAYVGLSYNWIPFYGKMSMLDDSIIYFDMAFSPGIGYVTYDHVYQNGTVPSGKESDGSALAISLDISQHFFIHEHWAIRVDFKNRFYNEKTVQSSGLQNKGADLGESSKTDSIFLIGVTYYH